VSLVGIDAQTLRRLLDALGHALHCGGATVPGDDYHRLRWQARHRWLDHGAIRYGLFPMLLAIPAFRLHQLIAFGGSFGEYLSFGAAAYLKGFLIWWGAWSLGSMLTAAALRILIEAIALTGQRLAPGSAATWRPTLEWIGRLAFYGLIPAWLVWRTLAS
jgi:apolipoprotein N-acyltransferase